MTKVNKQKVLNGYYQILDQVHPRKKILAVLAGGEYPDIVQTTMERSTSDFEDSWKIPREDTVTGSIHFRHFKDSAFHKISFPFPLQRFCLTPITSLKQWLQITDLIILKKEGIIMNADCLRTVCLFELDFNHSNTFLLSKG